MTTKFSKKNADNVAFQNWLALSRKCHVIKPKKGKGSFKRNKKVVW